MSRIKNLGSALLGLTVLGLLAASSLSAQAQGDGEASTAAQPRQTPTAAQPRQTPTAVQPRQIILAVDTSASMAANDPNGLVRHAVASVIDGLTDTDQVGLLTFDTHPRLIMKPMALGAPGVRRSLLEAVAQLEFRGQYTDVAEAIERASYALRGTPDEDVTRLIVLVTDGIIDTGERLTDLNRERWLRDDLLPSCEQQGVRIFGVAFTEAADYALLRTMAQQTNGGYYRALAPTDLVGIFEELEAAIAPLPVPAPVPTPEPTVTERTQPPPRAQPVEDTGPSPTTIGVITLSLLGLLVALFAFRRAGRNDVDEMPMSEATLHDLESGESIALAKRVMRVGRSPDSDIVIDSPTVSVQHALIEVRGGVYHVADLRSTNGTFVNDERVDRETVLRRGDMVRFDRFKYAFDGLIVDDQTQVSLSDEHTQVRANPFEAP